MTQRDRKLLFGAGGAAAVVVVLLAFNSLFLEPLHKSNQEILDLQGKAADKRAELRKRMEDKRELSRLKAISLPADPNPLHREYDLAWNEYDMYLRDLMRASGLKSVRISGRPPTSAPVSQRNKKPLYQVLAYTVDASGEATSVVAMLEQLYQTPLLHQIKELTIKPIKTDPGRQPADRGSRQVDVHLQVEALVVEGAEKRTYLFPAERRLLALNGVAALQHGLTGLPLVPWSVDWIKGYGRIHARPMIESAAPGQYAHISRKNIFYGPPVPKDPSQKRQPPKVDPNKFLILTSIIKDSDGKVQASLYNQLQGGRSIQLDPRDENARSIPVCRDTEDERLVRGVVVHIGPTEVVFRMKLVSRKETGENNGEKIICLDESKRLYRMSKAYWEALEEEETITSTSGSGEGSSFLFRGKVMGGVVVMEDSRYVVFEIYPKYLSRLYAIHLDESVESAVQEPLTARQIRELGMKDAEKSAKK
jgi:hypothetical protein